MTASTHPQEGKALQGQERSVGKQKPVFKKEVT